MGMELFGPVEFLISGLYGSLHRQILANVIILDLRGSKARDKRSLDLLQYLGKNQRNTILDFTMLLRFYKNAIP